MVNGFYKPTYNWGAPSCISFSIWASLQAADRSKNLRLLSAGNCSRKPVIGSEASRRDVPWKKKIWVVHMRALHVLNWHDKLRLKTLHRLDSDLGINFGYKGCWKIYINGNTRKCKKNIKNNGWTAQTYKHSWFAAAAYKFTIVPPFD